MQQAINRALNILEFVAKSPEQAKSFSDIARHSELNTGTCANILKALVQRGYLEKVDDKKGYLIGRKLFQLTNNHGLKRDVFQASKPVLDDLTEQFNENALVAILKENIRLVLYQTKSKHEIQVTTLEDKPAYDSSTGRLLVAMLPDAEREKFILKYGLPSSTQWKEASTREAFAKCVALIQKNGYAVQESEKHITGYAVPVYEKENIAAAISIYLPTYRFIKANKQSLITGLKKAALKISKELSF